MSQDALHSGYDLRAHGFSLPTPEEGLTEAKHRIALTLRPNEMVWLAGETYDPVTPAWLIDVVRQGAGGQWVRQRSRFDIQAQVLYYLGETPLSNAEFRELRRKAQVFQIAEWQAK
jgi:hypothetical protein